MSDLQKVAQGLLGLLDLKTLGKNPSSLDQAVRAQLEVADLYGASLRLVQEVTNAAANVPGAVALMTVPNGKIWRVHAASAQMVAAATVVGADGWGVSVGISPNAVGATTYVAAATDPRTAALAAQFRLKAPVAFRPALVLGAGAVIRAVLDRGVSANVQLSVEADYEEITV